MDEYLSSNPEPRITVNGKPYAIHMTFRSRSEAEEEARDLRDHFKKAKVIKYSFGYAVYEEV